MPRILLVDDEQDIREMLGDALTMRHHVVELAASATEALALGKNTAFDIAIIDYVLPGMRGLDLLQELRKHNPFIRSIIISGQIDHDSVDPKEIEKKLKERIVADRYFPKPVATDVLAQAVNALCKASTGRVVDWQKIALGAVAGRAVKKKDIQAADRELRRHRRKRDR
jgi:DNA-binding response OmpR family regulator